MKTLRFVTVYCILYIQAGFTSIQRFQEFQTTDFPTPTELPKPKGDRGAVMGVTARAGWVWSLR